MNVNIDLESSGNSWLTYSINCRHHQKPILCKEQLFLKKNEKLESLEIRIPYSRSSAVSLYNHKTQGKKIIALL